MTTPAQTRKMNAWLESVAFLFTPAPDVTAPPVTANRTHNPAKTAARNARSKARQGKARR
jgi:hypothetical protein